MFGSPKPETPKKPTPADGKPASAIDTLKAEMEQLDLMKSLAEEREKVKRLEGKVAELRDRLESRSTYGKGIDGDRW
jgi:hypothetical protein